MTLVYLRRTFWPWALPVMALVMCMSTALMYPALAQSTSPNPGPQWYPMVRPNLDSRSIVSDPKNPNIIYEGGANGVFKSTDGGATWRTINNGLTNVSVNVLAIDPVTTTTIYAGTDEGVFRSVDGGQNWLDINTNIPFATSEGNPTDKRYIVTLAIDLQRPGGVYAGSNAGDPNSSVAGGGLYYSSDYGNSWTKIGADIPEPIEYIATSSNSPNIVYVATFSNIFRSVDGGISWDRADNGIFPTGGIKFLAIDPADPTRIFASANYAFYGTIDGGANWDLINFAGINNTISIQSIAFDPADHKTVYLGSQSGIFKSTDSGNSWASVYGWTPSSGTSFPGQFGITNLVFSPVSPYQIFAGTGHNPGQGIFVSSDKGANWLRVNSGPVGTNIGPRRAPPLAIAPSQAATLYVLTENDLYSSINGGKTWNRKNANTSGGIPYALSVDPKAPRTLYASIEAGILGSTDAGDNWNLIFPTNGYLYSGIHVDPQASETIFTEQGSGIYKTVDRGKNWKNVYNQSAVSLLAINPNSTNRIYAVVAGGSVIYSYDGGDSWNPGNIVLPDFVGISSFAFDPVSPDIIYASGGTYFFTSTDGGQNWSSNNIGPAEVPSFGVAANTIFMLTHHPKISQTIYAATSSGILVTTDAGASWQAVNSLGLPDKRSFDSVILNPANPAIFYAGDSTGYLYTTDPAAAGGAPTPVSGWWWNPAEPGRGYGLEISSSGAMRLGLFGFDDSGFSHWWTASGTLDDSGNFTSSLIDAEFGNPLGTPQRNAKTTSVGSVSFAALTDATGTLTLPNGTQVPIQRYEFTPGGLASAPDSAAPRTGWWTSPNAPGQYFFIEVQNGAINASALSFDIDAGPVWYSDQTSAVAAGVYGGAWQELIGGQTLSSPYRAPKVLSNAATAGLRFSSPTSGSLIFGTTILPITWTGP